MAASPIMFIRHVLLIWMFTNNIPFLRQADGHRHTIIKLAPTTIHRLKIRTILDEDKVIAIWGFCDRPPVCEVCHDPPLCKHRNNAWTGSYRLDGYTQVPCDPSTQDPCNPSTRLHFLEGETLCGRSLGRKARGAAAR